MTSSAPLEVTFEYDVPCIQVAEAETNAEADQMVFDLTDTVSLIEAQQTCDDLQHIYAYLHNGDLPDDPQLRRKTVHLSEQYSLLDGILYHLYQPRGKKVYESKKYIRQIALPRKFRAIQQYHDHIAGGGHMDSDKTFIALRWKFYWPRMHQEIEDYVKGCHACQSGKYNRNNHPAPLNPIPVDAKLDRWHIDIMGPFDKSKDGYQYLLVAAEAYSKWPEAFPLRTQESTEIANILFNYVFARYGAPRKLVSDKGQNFISKLVLELCNMLNIRKYSTSPYHPQSNSTVERMNGTIQQSLRAYIIDNAQRGTTTRDWQSLLTSVLMGIRKSDCSQSTEHSPFYAMFGQEMNLPFDRAFIPASRLTADADEVIQTMVDNMKTTDTIIQDNLRKNQEKTKQRYDKKAKEPGFRLGDLVLLYTPRVPQGMSAKTHSKRSGPFYISEVKEKNTYTLRRWRDHKPIKGRVRANRLKKYHNARNRHLVQQQGDIAQQQEQENIPNVGPAPSQNDNAEHVDSQDEPTDVLLHGTFDVHSLTKCKWVNGKRQYLVKWEGYPNRTWEPEEYIPDHLVRHFHIHKTMDGRSKGKRKKR